MDFRNGFNGTAAACRCKINKNPLEGDVFVFINQNKTMLRLYLFDGHGELMITKRVAQGRFYWWGKDNPPPDLMIEHIQMLLRGGNPKHIKFPAPWKSINQVNHF